MYDTIFSTLLFSQKLIFFLLSQRAGSIAYYNPRLRRLYFSRSVGLKVGDGFKKIKLIKPQTNSIETTTTTTERTSQTVATITSTAMKNSATPKPLQSNNISTTSTASNIVAKPTTIPNNNSSNSIPPQTSARTSKIMEHSIRLPYQHY